MKKLLCLPLLGALFGCGGHESKGEGSGEEELPEASLQYSLSREEIDSLVAAFDKVDGLKDTLFDRPKELSVRAVLEKLHPALPKLIGKEEKIGVYRFLPFKNIPLKVRESILSGTRGEGESTGYAVFMRASWEKLFELQDEGYIVGVLDTTKDTRISGIYSHQQRKLGFDVLSTEGTIAHEFRHAEQYISIDPSRKGKIDGLSGECYDRVSSMFAETDATNIELPTWLGNMARISFYEDWYKEREKVLLAQSSTYKYPFAQNFETALYYPGKRAAQVEYTEDCPEEVKAFAKKLSERMDSARLTLGVPAQSLSYNQTEVFDRYKKFYTYCTDEGKPAEGSLWSERSCTGEITGIPDLVRRREGERDSFDKLLSSEIAVRGADLKAIYNEAPFFKEFCSEMPGFRFYADCP